MKQEMGKVLLGGLMLAMVFRFPIPFLVVTGTIIVGFVALLVMWGLGHSVVAIAGVLADRRGGGLSDRPTRHLRGFSKK